MWNPLLPEIKENKNKDLTILPENPNSKSPKSTTKSESLIFLFHSYFNSPITGNKYPPFSENPTKPTTPFPNSEPNFPKLLHCSKSGQNLK